MIQEIDCDSCCFKYINDKLLEIIEQRNDEIRQLRELLKITTCPVEKVFGDVVDCSNKELEEY